MHKYGHVFLVAIISILAIPIAHAEGVFFIGGQGGQIKLHDTNFPEDSGDMRALGLGYRWQAGSIVQVGFEVGGGSLGKLRDQGREEYFDASISWRETLESTYGYVGANARFQFGADSRWFSIVRLGYMGYEEKFRYSYESSYYDYTGTYITETGSGSESDSGGGIYFGAGIGMDITPNINISLAYNGYAYSPSFGEEDSADDDFYTASGASLGLEMRF